jgi:chorismate dehydratase
MTSRNLRVGVPVDFYTAPLVVPLAGAEAFVRHADTPARLALALREKNLEVAFLSPLEYARDSSLYEIIPGAGASSSIATGTVSVIFRSEHLHSVNTIAIDPAFSSEIVLARIVLAEEFELAPKFVPATGTVEEMLARADAVLLAGDASLRAVDVYPNRIDLIEAWTELTDLPYVHGMWVVPSGTGTPELAELLENAAAKALDSIDTITGSAPPALFPAQNQSSLADYLNAFSYDLSEEDLDGIQEYMRLAYYHGVLPDIGDLNIYSPTSPDRPDDDE